MTSGTGRTFALEFVMLVKTVASGQLIQEGQHVLMAPLDPFAKKVDARTALNDYARNNTVRNDRQSGAARRALPGLRKKEERASQCLETLIEGTIYSGSTKSELVRNSTPFVQALRESALRSKKKSDPPFELQQELERYVGNFAQQLLTVIATHLPNWESVVRRNLSCISIREWLAKIWQPDEEKPMPEFCAATCFETPEETLQTLFAATRFQRATPRVKVRYAKGVDWAWLKDSAQMFDTTVRINTSSNWLTCAQCLEEFQTGRQQGPCDCELLCQDQPKTAQLFDGEPKRCELIQVCASFIVSPSFRRCMYQAHWLPLVYM